MPQYTFDDGFYHASRARDIAVGGGAGSNNILTEINALQVAIDSATRTTGELEVTVGQTSGETIMTTEKVYYDAWNDLYSAVKLYPSQSSALRAAAIEMDRVIAYFTRLGYSIERVRGGTIASPPTIGTADRIQWIIKW